MTVEELGALLGCATLAGGDAMTEPVTDCYCGDILGRVMAGAPEGCVWITAACSANAAAVAKMTGAACILLAEGVLPDADALEKAVQNGTVILQSDRTAYELAVAVHGALSGARP